MFTNIPSASEKSKKNETSNNIKYQKIQNHINKILLNWTSGNNNFESSKQQNISVPIFKKIDQSFYDALKKDFESKGYYTKITNYHFTVSEVPFDTL